MSTLNIPITTGWTLIASSTDGSVSASWDYAVRLEVAFTVTNVAPTVAGRICAREQGIQRGTSDIGYVWVRVTPGSVPDAISIVVTTGPGVAALSRAPTTPSRGYPVLAGSGLTTASVAASSACTVTNVSRVAPNGQVLYGVRLQATGTTASSVDFNIRPQTFPNGRIQTLAYVDSTSTAVNNQLTTYLGDSTFANFLTNVYTRDMVGWWNIAPNSTSAPSGKWSVGGGTPVFGTTSFAKVRFRLDYANGQAPWIEIYGMSYDADVPKSWISMTADDGYSSQYTLMAPILEKYGMRGSFAIIADLIGIGGYMTVAQLQDLVARGHECVVHGPLGGAGSLLNYTASPTRAQDVYNDLAFHQAFLKANGLAKNGSERVYVFPQGQYEFAVGDDTILAQLRALNFVGGRGTNQSGTDNKRCFYGSTDWGRNIIGHTWTSSGAEAANITGIVARVATAATERNDCCLMNHKFITGASADSLTINTTDYETICAAIADQIVAGTMENVLLSQMVFSGNAAYQYLSL